MRPARFLPWQRFMKTPGEQPAEAGADEPPPPITAKDEQKATEEEELNAHVTYEVIRRAGEEELERSPGALAWSGLAAGLSMGFSFLVEALIHSHLPDASWTPLISAVGYTTGFLLVILGKQQLFTETTLTAVIPLLANRQRKTLRKTLRMWGVVLAANLAGAMLFALVLAVHSLFTADIVHSLDIIAARPFEYDALHNMIRAIFAGWLIALMVWMLPAAGEMDTVVIILVTYVVGAAAFPHIIAGSVDTFYAGVTGLVSWRDVLLGFTLPTLVGNTVGGVALVAGLAHAQVASGGGKAA
jgi:formate/nitrite transporter FocA (FNT family)